MEIGLLKYTIEEIERLKFLFSNELKSIKRKSKKGMKDNSKGFAIITYIRALNVEDKLKKESESYTSFSKFMNSFVEILHSENDDNRSVKFKIKNIDKLGVSDSFDPINEAIEFEKYLNMERLFLEETIIMLMVKFEDAISNLLHCLFERYPDKYLADKTISYSEIVKYNSSELESYIITNLIDKTMRKDYTEWFKIFQNHGISIEKYGIYDDFIELYCRRNIIVHNKSIVNSSYLNGISKTKISKPELDSHLLVDENYVLKAFNTIECIILSIFLECGRFFKNSDKNKYLDEVFNVGFDFLCREQYDVSEFIFEQLEKLDVENITKMMSKVNRWISQKAKYGIDSVKNEIEKTDFSALNDSFILAKYILLENYDDAIRILETKTDNALIATSLLEWPLYKDFRKTQKFKIFKENHKELFNVKELDSTNSDNYQNISYSEIQSNLEQ